MLLEGRAARVPIFFLSTTFQPTSRSRPMGAGRGEGFHFSSEFYSKIVIATLAPLA